MVHMKPECSAAAIPFGQKLNSQLAWSCPIDIETGTVLEWFSEGPVFEKIPLPAFRHSGDSRPVGGAADGMFSDTRGQSMVTHEMGSKLTQEGCLS